MKKTVNEIIKKRQNIIKIIFLLFILVIFIIIICLLLKNDQKQEIVKQSDKEKPISTVTNGVNLQEIWVRDLENENKILSKKIDQLEKIILDSIAKDEQSKYRFKNEEITDLQQQISDLKMELEKQAYSSQSANDQRITAPIDSSLSSFSGSSDYGHMNREAHSKVVINLNKKEIKEAKHIDNTIPAGSFAKAVLIGGIDASTSVESSSDPRPILMRLVDHGTLPRQFKSHIDECHVLAGSYGDLSSERVFMRLEKLTCVDRFSKEILETSVSGYVAGEDGKAGVRGVVVDKAGPVLRNTFISGFLGGVGSFIESTNRGSVFPVSPFGQTNAMGAKDILKSGAASGTSNAFEKYADFWIKRAEQLQPVIQVSAGRIVDIVLTDGASIIEAETKRFKKKKNKKQLAHINSKNLHLREGDGL